jgi:hypothetical protein
MSSGSNSEDKQNHGRALSSTGHSVVPDNQQTKALAKTISNDHNNTEKQVFESLERIAGTVVGAFLLGSLQKYAQLAKQSSSSSSPAPPSRFSPLSRPVSSPVSPSSSGSPTSTVISY